MKAHKTDRWFAEAYAAHQRGDLDEAERGYRRILRRQAGDAETLYLLGTVRLQQRRYPEAVELLARARKPRPQHPETLNNLGLALQETEDFSGARACFEQAITAKPDYAYAHNNLARILERDGSIDDAIAGFQKAAELDASYADASYNLGLLLKKRDRFAEAQTALCRAVELAPNEARIWNDLGTVYKAIGRLAEAERCAREALAREAGRFDFWNNLGAVLQERGDFAGALTAYQRAEALRPEDPLPVWNQAFALLSAGRLAEGWLQHEARWGVFGGVSMPCPAWSGETLLGGTLLVLAEQGLGDEIMFASCLPDTLRRASQVIVDCAPRLAPIFARSFPQARVVVGADRSNWGWLVGLPKPDRAICIGSLPRWFRPDLESFPKALAYLYADSERTAYWRERLTRHRGEGLKIGMCWRSGLRTDERHKYYTALEDWMPLFAVPGVHFINLQYGDCAVELAEARERFGVDIVDFTEIDLRDHQDEVAALMSALDLVISAATAVAELAGALGRPVWRFSTTISWTSLGTDHYPWHPSMRLFDKALPDEPWAPVFERMAAELRRWGQDGPTPEPPATEAGATAMTLAMSSNYIGLALEARAAGRLEEARRHCRRVLAEYPEQPDAWHLLGVVLRDLGAREDAVSAFDRAHAARPEDPSVLVNRGRTLQDLGRIEPASRDFRAALELDDGGLDARLSLGELLDARGEWQEAEAVLRPALTLASDEPRALSEVHYALAQSLHHQRRLAEAEAHLRDALRLNPDYPGAHNGLGNVLRDQDRLEEALACYRAALALRPDLPEFHSNLGNALRELNRLREAEAAYREALRLRPDYADAWSNLGNLLIERDANREALQAYRRALELAPDDAETRWNISFSLLQAGELAEGWAAYEWRWRTGQQPPVPRLYPEWNGEDPSGRTLLVLPEQGLGDEILFASCIPDLLARAGRIVLVCQQRLTALYARSFPTATVIALPAGASSLHAADLPACDLQIAIGSLPRLLRTRIEDFPARPAYLLADPTRVAQWRTRLDALGAGLKIGVCWRSGLRTGERHRYYPTLADWEPILKTPGALFINLQYDECAAELGDARARFGAEIVSFADLDLRDDQDGVAALITALDGVIAAPTAVAELAAALGVPVLRYFSSWTALGVDYMPWHPTMRLFDKPDLEQPWASTMSAIAAALGEWTARETSADRAAVPLQLVETRHGSMLVAGAGAAARDLRQSGEHASEAVALLASLLRPGDWVIEAGADLGAFTLPLARAVGVDGLVIACEPRRDEFRLLCANLALNGMEQVHAERLALDAAVPMPAAAPESAWLRARAANRESVDALSPPRCDLLRIGAGADALAVLDGARATLDRCKPFIHVEACADAREIGAWLCQAAYAWQERTRADAFTDVLGYPGDLGS